MHLVGRNIFIGGLSALCPDNIRRHNIRLIISVMPEYAELLWPLPDYRGGSVCWLAVKGSDSASVETVKMVYKAMGCPLTLVHGMTELDTDSGIVANILANSDSPQPIQKSC